MKTIYILTRYVFSFLICFSISIFSQGEHPFSETPTLLESSEIVLVWSENFAGDSSHVYAKIYDYNETDTLQPYQKKYITSFTGSSQVDVATGDFNADGKTDFVVAYEGNSNKIKLFVPHINSDLTWDEWSPVDADGFINTLGGVNERFKLKSGNFDSDANEEIVLAYVDSENKLRLEIFNVDASLNIEFKNFISDELIDTNYARFNIALADFDLDGTDEIIVIGSDYRTTDDIAIFATVYDVSDNFYIEKKGTVIIPDEIQDGTTGLNVGIVTGDFNNDVRDDVALYFNYVFGDTTIKDTWLYVAEVSEDLENILIDGVNQIYKENINLNFTTRADLNAGDLDGDGIDEIVMGTGGGIKIFDVTKVDSFMVPNLIYQTYPFGIAIEGDDILTNNFVDVLDVAHYNKDYIVQTRNIFSNVNDQKFDILLYGSELKDTLIIEQSSIMNQDQGSSSSPRHYAIAMGDFDGDNVRVGKPTRYVITDIVQPMVILNAPPIHFDKIGNDIFDLSGCFPVFPDPPCADNFFAGYTVITQINISTEVHKEWGLDESLEASVDVGVFKASLKASYGEGFSKTSGASEKITTTQIVTATIDDKVFATVQDYELWEYPVISDTGFSGNIIVLYPRNTTKRWFSYKHTSGESLKPHHENANILSYFYYNNLEDNEDIDRLLGGIGDEYTVSSTGSFSQTLNWEQHFTKTEMRSNRIGLEVGASIGGFGMEIGVNSKYSAEEVSTHKTEVGSSISIEIHLGTVDPSIGSTDYIVKPYAYWAQNGALVIDYAVRPDNLMPGQWWYNNYGTNPDPTFILPWKLDPEKEMKLTDPSFRSKTKEITFKPANAGPGDTVTISARIHNYSLISTTSPVSLSFYVNDPDSGGTLITGTNGESIVTTGGAIDARENKTVQLEWDIPTNVFAGSRIYAIIDPENLMTELQENNNKGWSILGGLGIITDANDIEVPVVDEFELSQNYPNPFNPQTRITYSISSEKKVSLKIYDILGREVVVLVNEVKPAGSYEVNFNASNLASGVYFYRLHAGSFIKTKKMMLLK